VWNWESNLTAGAKAMSKEENNVIWPTVPDILLPALRQHKHISTDPTDGSIAAFDYKETCEIVAQLQKRITELNEAALAARAFSTCLIADSHYLGELGELHDTMRTKLRIAGFRVRKSKKEQKP
jgi:hypothetical protein